MLNESDTDDMVEIELLVREYESALRVTSDPEEQRRVRDRIVQELRASLGSENVG